jgi:glycosyltransferase involved in cell wall biosynthesis
MRIGIEAQRIFRPKKHGMDIVALETIKHLQQIDRSNQYFVFVKDDVDNKVLEPTDNFEIINIKSPSYLLWEQWELPKKVKSVKLDMLHCTSNTAPLKLSCPLVLTLHDIIFLEGQASNTATRYQQLGRIYRRWNVPQTVAKAKKIITVSDYENQVIAAYFRERAQDIITVHNGAGAHFKKIDDLAALEQFRTKYNLPKSFTFFIGNTDPKKNVRNVLAAFKLLHYQYNQQIYLVMPDLNETYFASLIKELGLEELKKFIVLTGYIANKDLPMLYNLADVFLYPSLRESFGIPILEAMNCGTPVLTSNTSSMPEVAGDAALFVNPKDENDIAQKWNSLLIDKSLRDELSQKGIQQSAKFSWLLTAEKVKSIYETLEL